MSFQMRKLFSVRKDRPNPDDLDATWAYIKCRLPLIMLKGTKGRRNSYTEIYSATHDYCTYGAANPPGAGLYMKLIDYIEDDLHNILEQIKVHPSEDSLVFFIREWDRFTNCSMVNSRALQSLYRHWVLRMIDEGYKGLYDLSTLHTTRRDSILIPGVQGRIRFEVWKAAVTRPTDEIVRHPGIEQIIGSASILRPMASPLSLRLRRIVLLTRPVDRLRGMTNKAENSDGLAWPTISHWALSMKGKDKPHKGTLYEIKVQKGAVRPVTRRYSKKGGWARRVIGDTLLSDYDVRKHAKMVALMMQNDYRPLSNNCQRFCNNLFESIRIPRNEDDALQGIEEFPYEFAREIRSRRCQEFECLSYARYTGSVGPISSMPTPVETCAVVALSTAPIIFVRMELNAWRLIYMMFLVGLYVLYAPKRSVPGFKLIYGRKKDPLGSIYRELHLEGIPAHRKHPRGLGSSSLTVSQSPSTKGRRKIKTWIVGKQGTRISTQLSRG